MFESFEPTSKNIAIIRDYITDKIKLHSRKLSKSQNETINSDLQGLT
jgi:hypothetical protein